MFRTRVACGRNPRTAEVPRPLRYSNSAKDPAVQNILPFALASKTPSPAFASAALAAPIEHRITPPPPTEGACPPRRPASSLRPSHSAPRRPTSSPRPSHSAPRRPTSSPRPSHSSLCASSPGIGPAAASVPSPGIGPVARAAHRPANRSGRAFSRREASRACAPKRAQSGMIRLKHKETRPSSRPPPRSTRPLPPIARNEQVGFCRHFGRE